MSYTDGGSTAESLTSAPTNAVTNTNDAPAGLPTISGVPTQGGTLTAETSAISDADGLGSFSYQWQGNDNDIDSATSDTFVLTQDQVGQTITVKVSYTDGGGTAETLTSAPTNAVTNINDDPTGLPTSTATQGATLTAGTDDIADADGLGSFSYQWQAGTDAISSATSDTFVLTQDQVGQTITVKVSYTDGGGTAETLTSAPTNAVTNINDDPTGLPTISGVPTQGGTLTAVTAAISDADGLGSFSYQWQAGDDAISGADEATFVLTQAEVGKTITVTVSYTDGGSTTETLTSAATNAVTNINDDPAGLPTITGIATQGATLTAVTDDIADADGLGTFSYQWQAGDDAISGADEATFVLTQAEVGKTITVTVSYTDGGETTETLTSVATDPVTNTNDAPAGLPTISGTPTQGEILTAVTSAISDADGLGSFSYQWQADTVDISGATSSTFVLTQDQVGKTITVKVSYTDGGNHPETLTSAATNAVTNTNDDPTGLPTITGTPTQGATLTADTSAISDADGLGTFSYQWQGNDNDIDSATSDTFVLTQDQVGQTITVKVSYTDGGGTAETLTSAPTNAVTNINDDPTGLPTISGTATQGATLTAGTDDIRDADGVGSFSYQWQGNDNDIDSATSDTFVLTQDQVGQTITVKVSYTDGGGTAETLTSAPTNAVTNTNDAPVGLPTISGVPTQGGTLTAVTSAISDADGVGSFSYQWQGNDNDIDSATSDTFILTQAQVGQTITVTVSYTDGGSTAETLTSAPTNAVTNTNDAPAGLPTISGVPTQGGTLTAETSAISDADGVGSFSYQWQGNDNDIDSATSDTFILTQAQVGQTITVTVSYTDGGSTAETLTSAPTNAVTNTNDAPAGLPTISGVPTQGGTLTAETSAISDADGLGSFSYQWQGNDNDIDSATSDTFILTQAQVGQTITVTVSYTDGGSTAETLTSAPTNAVTNTNDAPAGLPTISGVPTQGGTLTAETSAISDADGLGSFSYQWQGNDNDIDSATSDTFVLTQDQVGKTITVEVSYTDGGSTAESLTSAPTNAVTNTNDDPTGLPTITGTATQGATLTAGTDDIADADGLGSFSYQWQGNDNDIDSATSDTFVLTQDQVGQTITVKVSYTDGGGTAESLTSAPTNAVTNTNDAPVGLPTISGVPTQGGTLTAVTSAISDADGVGSFSYQWQGNDNDIDSATSDTFILTQAQVGQTITVTVSYTDGGSTAETLTSAPTNAVTNTNDAPAGLPTISGVPTQGGTLTAETSAISDADGLGSFSYQWQGNDNDIDSATSDTFILTQAQVGQTITVKVSYTDGGSTAETLTSAPTNAVTNTNDAPAGLPTISGVPTQGGTLTAETSAISDADGLGSFSYQWQGNDNDIDSATSDTFILTQAQVGQTITVTVSYTDGGSTAETLTSAPTNAVTNTNDAPAGLPTISGVPTQGGTLTAETSAISDADGTGTFSYQWQADTVDISDATSDTFVLTQDQVGQTITVKVSYTDQQGTAESLTSAPTNAVTNTNDAPVGLPTISGVPTQGGTLTAVTSAISDADGVGSFSYQWQGNDNDIDSATSDTFILTQAQVGQTITVTVSYTDGGSTAESLTSAPTNAVTNINDDPTGLPTISGVPTQGGTLTAVTSAISDADGLGSFSYQWQAGTDAISSATSDTFILTQAQVGQTITVTVSYTDGGSTAETLTSAPTNAVTNTNDAPAGLPTISGVPTQGGTLTAETSAISDADGLGSFSYQWQGNDNDIDSATSDTFVLTQDQVGQTITVKVSYTDGGGTAETLTSAPTNAVTNINDDPTGLPTISGVPTQGGTLTAVTDDIADADGLGSFSYQWQGNDNDIDSATSDTFILTQAQVGQTITVTVSYTDGGSTAETLTSAPTNAVTNTNDAPAGLPTISGVPTQGGTLTAETSAISDADGLGSFSYQWQGNDNDIDSATSDTFVLTQDQVGQTITVKVSYTDGGGTAETLTSAPTNAVTNINDDPTGLPTITGTATQGATLTAGTDDIADADGLGSFSYQWQAGTDAISSATSDTFVLTQDQVGQTITVKVSYTDGGGTAETLTSAPTNAVTNINDDPTGLPTISGVPTQGGTLTAVTDDIADADGLGSFSYQWQADTVDISGATSDTFVLTQDQVGQTITVKVSYTDQQGTAESLTSAATNAVTNINDAPTITGTTTFTIAENADDGAMVGTITGADVDTGTTLTYSIIAGNTNDAFTIDSASGDITVHGENTLDYETTPSYSLTVVVSDGSLTATATVAITVTDVTESATFTIADLVNAEIQENTPYTGTPSITGTPVGTVTWALAGADTATFTIDTTTGVVSMIARDYEAPVDANRDNIYSATVTATDNDSNRATQDIAITVTDVTESATFTIADLVNAEIQENTPYTGTPSITGTPVGTVTWALAGADTATFTIDTTTGVVSMIARDYEAPVDADNDNIYSATVTATDSDSNHTTKDIAITVTDVNEAPTIAGTPPATIAEDTAYRFIPEGGDKDANDTPSYSLSNNPDWLSVNTATGELSGTPANADVGEYTDIVLTITSGGASATLTFSIEVTNTNDVGTLTISGTASEGDTLIASVADADGIEGVVITYQWQAGTVVIADATSNTYTLTRAEVGKTITVTASYTDQHGTTETLTVTTDVIIYAGGTVPDNSMPVGLPQIFGTPTQGAKLVAVIGGIKDADGADGPFTYQWLGAGSAISGATDTFLVLTQAQVGQTITVTVSYTDGGNHLETLTSVATAAVTNTNDAPTGLPTISGTPTQGETLTADTSTISDADGLGSFNYQWQAGTDDISGATSSTFVLTQDQVGQTITVKVSYTDGGGTTETLTSVATAAVTNTNDAPTGLPTISGTPTQGETLTADTSTISDADGLGSFNYQWQAGTDDISGATSSTFVLTQDQVGQTITVKVSYTDGGGTTETLTSVATAAVTNTNDAPTGLPTISGTPTQGETLTADASAISDADGLGSFSYQWQADTVDISGATSSTFVLTQDQVGKTITVKVSYTDGGNHPETLTSAATNAVTNTNDDPTGLPTITGTPTQGATLTADTSAISDADGLGTFSYQWQAGTDAISGATDTSLELTQAEVGKTITVKVSYTDGGETTETLTSAPTHAVTSINDDPTGLPTISGVPTQGGTLTAVTSAISDADGLGSFSYQWQAGTDAISGADEATFVLMQAQVGQTIKVTVSYTDGGSTAESLTSVATAAVTNTNDAPTGLPTITGTPTQGSTLTAVTSAISDADGLGSFSYQWQGNDNDIDSAASDTFVLTQDQVGQTITVKVSYTDGGNHPETLTSAATNAVTNTNDDPTGLPTITGTPTQGKTLTAVTAAISDADGLGSFSYQWQAGDDAISGADEATFVLTQAEVGKTITVTVSYTDGGSTTETLTSAATNAVTNINDDPAGLPTITGIATQGATLTAVTDDIADADGLGTFSYQWQAGDDAISGADEATFVLTQAEVGKTITVTVSYTDGGETTETLTSVATDPVTNTNDAPAGLPTISGTPTQGEILTAVTSAISDADGLGSFSYQWQADTVDISGATSSTFVLTQDQVGKTITVKVSYTDGGNHPETLTSAATNAVTNTNDDPTGLPTITGTPTQGATLTADTSAISDADGLGTFSYQWQAGTDAISGATDTSLELTQAEVGKTITVTVSYTDGGETTETLTSVATDPVTNTNDAPAGLPTISGTPTQGEILTAVTSAISDADGLGSFSYQWQGNDNDIDSAASDTFVLTQDQVGQTITVKVSYTDGGGTTETLTSVATAAVTNTNDAPTGLPTISGTPTQGETLTADASAIRDADGLGSFSYQWQTDAVDISGATSSTFVLTQDQVGQTITVKVSYTDGGGTTETLTSVATDEVTNVNDAPTGLPTISGTATQGETLTAVTTAIRDADGLGSFSYQWQAGTDAISSATSDTFVLTQDQVGKTITVEVSYTDQQGTDETLTSAPTNAVTNTNDAPTITGTTTFTIAENAGDGAMVGTITGADVDAGTSLAYSITAGNTNDAFAIGSATGAITVNGDNKLDYETTPSYSLTVSVSDSSLEATATVTINVEDVNEAPTITGTPPASIAQDTAYSFTPGGGDVDAGDIPIYSLSNNPTWLMVNIATGELSGTPTNADVGLNSRIVLSVASNEASATLLFDITVTNRAGNLHSNTAGTVTISGTAREREVLTATVTDADGIDGVSITYQWQAGTDAISGADEATFILTQAQVGQIITVTVSYTDGGGTDESLTSAPTGVVANVNDAPTITGTPTTTVAQDAEYSFTPTGTDVDGDTLTYSMTNTPPWAAFNTATGTLSGTPTNTHIGITEGIFITVSDGTLTASLSTFSIIVTNVNEAPTITSSTFTIAENADDGAMVGTITGTATDADTTLTYSMTAGNAGVFALDSATGVITVSGDHPLDYETTPSYSLTVAVSDGSLTATATVTINVTNVNEAPTITSSTFTIAENAGDGATVGTITGTATDADTTLTYAMTAVNAGHAFALDSATGAITVNGNNKLDHETTPSYSLMVTVSDGSLEATATVTITVTDIDESATFTITGLVDDTVQEGEIYTSATPTTAGATPVGTLTWTLSGDDVAGCTIDDAIGVVSMIAQDFELPVDKDRNNIYLMTVTATDRDGNEASANIAITVTPITNKKRIKQLNKAIMPRLAQTIIANSAVSVEHRVDTEFSNAPRMTSYQLDGSSAQLDGESALDSMQNTVEQKLPTYIKALKDETLDWKRMLGNSSFVMSLDSGDGTGSGATVWGSGAYTGLDSKSDAPDVPDWRGEVISVQLGVDKRVHDDLLVGGLVSWSEGDVDYTLAGERGKYTHQVTSVHPYLAWSRGDVKLWGSAGYGRGNLAIEENDVISTTDTDLLSLLVGVKKPLSPASGLSIKSDIALIHTRINESTRIAEQDIASQRLRLLLEVEREYYLATSVFNQVAGIGLRYDGGAGDTGVGVELSMTMHYDNPIMGLAVWSQARALLGRDDYKEWGVQGVISLDSGADEHGLSFKLSPSYGNTGSRMGEIWRQGLLDKDSDDSGGNQDDGARMEAYLGYGLSAPNGRGLLLPYAEMTFGDSRSYRLGLRWKRSTRFDVNIVGERSEGSTANHKVMLESRIRL